MEPNLSTVVVEPRLLVREALKCLMAKSSYRVVCDVGATGELSGAAVSDDPVVILGAQSADGAVSEAGAIRKLWPSSLIVLLYEYVSHPDLHKLLASEINGCVPLSASSETLIGTLNTIVAGRVRVMIAAHAVISPIQPVRPEESHQSNIKVAAFQLAGAEDEAVPDGSVIHTRSLVSGATIHPNPNRDVRDLPADREHPKLSGREVQVLNGLVKGHANKVIARTCEIAEATVKVHIKAILRKIRVGNRTQAAIWALENGYSGSDLRWTSVETDVGPDCCGENEVLRRLAQAMSIGSQTRTIEVPRRAPRPSAGASRQFLGLEYEQDAWAASRKG